MYSGGRRRGRSCVSCAVDGRDASVSHRFTQLESAEVQRVDEGIPSCCAALPCWPCSASAPDGGNNRVRVVDANQVITTVAGTGTAGSAGNDGPATAAQLTPSRV